MSEIVPDVDKEPHDKGREPLSASLTSGPVHHQIVSLSIPMVWGILAVMAFNVTDTYFVGKLGSDPLAAMTFTFPIALIATSIAIGLSVGTNSVIARALGEGDFARVKRVATDSLSLTFIIAVIFGLAGYSTIEPLFSFLGAKPELLPYLNDYMSIWYLNIWLLIVPLVGLGIARAIGHSLIQGRVMVAMAVINLILDPILIFGLFGMPRLELQGAAIASVIARIISLLVTLYYLKVKLDLVISPFVKLSEIMTSYKHIARVGVPALGTNIIIPVSQAVMVAMVATHGKEAVAGVGIANRIEPVALVFFYALSSIIGPFVGQNLGAKIQTRIEKAILLCVAYCLIIGAVTAITFALLAENIVSLFSTSQAVIDVAVAYIYIVPLSYGAAGVVMVVNAAFNGLGYPLQAVTVSLLRVIILFLPLAYCLNYAIGVNGIFVALTIVNLIMGVVSYYWLRQRVRSLF